MFGQKFILTLSVLLLSSLVTSCSSIASAEAGGGNIGNSYLDNSHISKHNSHNRQYSSQSTSRLPFYRPMNSPAYFTDDANRHIPTNQQWLALHNKVRQQHQVADLVWSETLAKSAQNFVNHCPSGHSGVAYGENIFFASAQFPLKDVFHHWYKEESLYDYRRPRLSKHTGHFTQIVWKNTTQVGCAYKADCTGKWKHIWVCHYNPKGNIRLRFAKNVFPKR